MKGEGLIRLNSAIEFTRRKEVEPGVLRLWEHFLEITRIPRQSGHEKLMTRFLLNFGQERADRGIETYRDDVGNVLMIIPASNGCKNQPKLILQGHQDMVCEKSKGKKSPAEKGVQAYISKDGKKVKANGTTLGADNGIGVASMLSLVDELIKHGQLALLLTVGEETGLDGVRNMKFDHDFTQYQAVINVDSEDMEEATIGCAGGGNSLISKPVERTSSKGKKLMRIDLTGGKGGHSGIEIAHKRANALKELNSSLMRISKQHDVNLVSLEAGTVEKGVPIRNAIPSEASAVIAIDPKDEVKVKALLRNEKRLLRKKYQKEKLGFAFKPTVGTNPEMMTGDSTQSVMKLIKDLPHGVYKWQKKPDGGRMPALSTNVAIARTEVDAIKIDLMSRSSDDEELGYFRRNIVDVADQYGATVVNTDPYPAWNPPQDLDLYDYARQVYKRLFNRKLKMAVTHGGLELGFFYKMWPGMPMISIGPTIEGAHSVNESVTISTVARFYTYLREIVSGMTE